MRAMLRIGQHMENKAKSIIIYTHRASFPGGRAYLCNDCSLSSERAEASQHWDFQFDAIVKENWILTIYGPAFMEVVG